MTEFIVLIFMLAVFVVLLDTRSSLRKQLKKMDKSIDEVRHDIGQIRKNGLLDEINKQTTEKEHVNLIDNKIIPDKIPEKKKDEEQKNEPAIHDEQTIENSESEILEQRIQQISAPPFDLTKERKKQELAKKASNSGQKITQRPRKARKKPDWEKLIGEKLFQYVGILFTVLAIGFFVKWAIDRGWINEIGRVAIGYLAGALLLGVAHKLHKNFKTFSSVLMGGGLAALYVTTAMGFQLYHIFSQAMSFVLMVVITGFSVLMALLYDRRELAVIALIGGFITPLLASNGGGNYKVLFSYLLILDIGMLILANLKNWRIINTISFFGTVIFYVGWLALQIDDGVQLENGAIWFASAFYIIFLAMHMYQYIAKSNKISIFSIILLVSNAFWYYVAGMLIANQLFPHLQGLFTAIVAVFHFILAAILYNKKQIDKNVIFVLISFVMIFLSIAAPVQLEGNYITLFWAAEAVILLWLSQLMNVKIIKLGATIVLLVMVGSLIMDWDQIYMVYQPENLMPIILNKGFITSMGAIVSLAVFSVLLKKDTTLHATKYIKSENYNAIIGIILVIAGYVSFYLEISYQLENRINQYWIEQIGLAAYNSFFALLILGWSYAKKIKYLSIISITFSVLITVGYVFDTFMRYNTTLEYYLTGESNYHFAWLQVFNVVAATASVIIIWKILNQIFKNKKLADISLWYMAFVLILLFSKSLDAISISMNFTNIDELYDLKRQTVKVGYPILWGISSLVFMIIGMKGKLRTLRFVSLTLFILTLIKLFAYDIKDISEGGRIAAFISLGIFLLMVSFLYQKLKKLIFEDENNEEVTEESTENNDNTTK